MGRLGEGEKKFKKEKNIEKKKKQKIHVSYRCCVIPNELRSRGTP